MFFLWREWMSDKPRIRMPRAEMSAEYFSMSHIMCALYGWMHFMQRKEIK